MFFSLRGLIEPSCDLREALGEKNHARDLV